MSNVYESKHPLVAHKLSLKKIRNTEPRSSVSSFKRSQDFLHMKPQQTCKPCLLKLKPAHQNDCASIREKIGLIPILRTGAWYGGKNLGVDAISRSLALGCIVMNTPSNQ
ncbi:MAG: hypothetical protein U0Z26_09280 [Anaerolineales bacterium]